MIISIDGASRRNGQANCLAAGGVFYDNDTTLSHTGIAAAAKEQASNQQGELLGLIAGLKVATKNADEVIYILTDSEYIFNALSKDWIGNWINKGWVTASDAPVKNKELWQEVAGLLKEHHALENELLPYHIKGHLVSIGKVTAAQMLKEDTTGMILYNAAFKKYEHAKLKKPDKFEEAYALFRRNNGFMVDESLFKKFVAMNTVADYVAGSYADIIDASSAS